MRKTSPSTRKPRQIPGEITSELSLIDYIGRQFPSSPRKIPLGIGDDCAILRVPFGQEVLVTTDLTLEGRHFRRELHPAASVGHRCLARGLSDLAAMGAMPVAAFLSLALPGPMLTSVAGRTWVTDFLAGLRILAQSCDVTLAGGDTSESPGGKQGMIFADIVLVGTAPKGKALRRTGALPGNALYVTGRLGGAAAELAAILKRNRVAHAASTDDHPHLFPMPRLEVGKALLRRKLATACLDISDGLSTDLAHLCRASRVSAEVDRAALPIHPLAQNLDSSAALHAALHGGEDYELLFTARASVKLPRTIAGVPITRIGSIIPQRRELMTLVETDGRRVELKSAGWEHFSRNASSRTPRKNTTR